MTKYFDHTFFKFLIGFSAVIVMSVSAIIITNYLAEDYYEDQAVEAQSMQTSVQTSMEFMAEDVCPLGVC